MTISELMTFMAISAFAVVVLPLIFIQLDKPTRKIFDKSDLEYKDGDNT